MIELDVNYVRFRHPLMRSAVRQAGPIEHRRRAHNALAQALTDDPDRRVWRRAALIGGTHEHVAAELEQTGRRARRRGAISVAATAMRRAAEFCGPAQRARRLVAAAELTFELGQLNVVVTLLREVELLSPGPVERARAAWIDEMISLRAPSPTWATALIAVAEQAGAAGDHGLHFSLLWRVATRFWWARACSRLSAIQTVGLLPTPASTCATCARASSTRPTCIAASARFEMIGGGGRGRSRAHRRKCGAPTSSSRWRSAGESPLRSDEVRVLAIQAYADPFSHASTGCHTHVYRIYSKLWTALASA